MFRSLLRIAAISTLALASTTNWAAEFKINVVSPTGATVTLDGQRQLAPATFKDISNRDQPYTFTVEKAGYQTETLSFTYREISDMKRSDRARTVTLEPLTMEKEITIKTSPDGATVIIDGKPTGSTPLSKTASFTRDSKTSPWKALAVSLTLKDYQGESLMLSESKPTADVGLSQLRLERTILIETKSGESSSIQAIQAMVSVDNREVGPAPQKLPLVFTRADKTKPWSSFVVRGEIPTIYQPVQVTINQDTPIPVVLTLKPVTELAVPLYSPVIVMSPTGAKLVVSETTKLGTLESGERTAEIAGLTRVTRFVRRDQNLKAPLQALNSYAITPDGESAIFSITSQDDAGKYYSGLFLKRVEDEGGGIARLVDNNKRYFDANPVIAPDSNNVLVFQSNRGDLQKPDIFRISFTDNRTAGGVSRITNDQRFNYGPTYTDSNREVVYLSIEPNYPLARPQLSTVKFDGALPTQFQILAEEVSHREHSKIYFTRIDESNGKRQIYSVEPDGRLETNLISDDSFLAANCFNPVASFASPVRILFVSDRDKDDKGRPNNNVYLMNADGSQIQQLTGNGSDDILPAWSPTDPNIVFILSNRGGAYNLWKLRLK